MKIAKKYQPLLVAGLAILVATSAAQAQGTWSTARLSQGRGDLAAGGIGNLVFFAGGSSGTGNVVDIYDTVTHGWGTATLSQGRYHLSAAAAGGQVLFAGGYSNASGYSNVVDIYDNTTHNWSTATLALLALGGAALLRRKRGFRLRPSG